MTTSEIRRKYLEFFKKRGHAIIPSASLVPENDPSSLFTTAGMQPLVPYLLGEKHPLGTRLADVQKCVRTGDIDDVGDNRHLTFFEMLGNWSLGDYFKREAISWSFEFLTDKKEGLGLDKNRIYVTVFKGENGIPRDEEAIAIWKNVFEENGIVAEVADESEKVHGNVRIIPLGVNDNFWIAGATGPCGSDTEMFYDTRPQEGKLNGKFSDYVDSFRLIEVWNDVFMEFNKTADGKYEKLAKRNVDTGMGLERTAAVVNNENNVFDTDVLKPIIGWIQKFSKNRDQRSERIIADHIRTAVFMIADGVSPSNTDRGYVLRRLLRRAIRYSDALMMRAGTLIALVDAIVPEYRDTYPYLQDKSREIKIEIEREEEKFRKTLREGLKELQKMSMGIFEKSALGRVVESAGLDINGKNLFYIYSTFGFPFELSIEEINKIRNSHGKDYTLDPLTKDEVDKLLKEFNAEFKKHQELSRAGSEKKFRGGLGDTSDISVKYHTATHLLNAALRKVLGDHVMQKGSNITPERLRFDFSHPQKMTDEEKKKVENQVNEWIKEALPVTYKELPKAEAEKVAIHAFGDKYGDVVKVYSIGTEGNYISREFCGGPHISNTSELGHFKIQKEEAVAQGVRRIKAVLD